MIESTEKENPARMSFYVLHPEHKYEQNVDTIYSRYVPRIGEQVLVSMDGKGGSREDALVVGVKYMHPHPNSPAGREGLGPLVDILVEPAPRFWREDPNVVLPPDDEE